tara:strand:- start:6342 stop:7004 length:663 start_codon:yes stop_codon:yes gene_type:complete
MSILTKHPAAPQDSFAFSNNINYDPGTIMVAGSTISAGASLYSGLAESNAYNAQSQVDLQNAELAEDNAAATMELAYQNIAAFEEEYDSFESETIVNYAKSGVKLDSPTVIEVMHDNRSNAEVEKAMIRYNARIDSNEKIVQAGQFKTQAAINRMNAKAAKIKAIANAGSSMVTAYGGYKQVKTQSVFNKAMLKSQKEFTQQLILLNNNHRMLMAQKGIY